MSACRASGLALLGIALGYWLTQPSARGATFSVANNGLWSDPATWTPGGGPPGSGDTANVGTAGSISPASVTLGSNHSVNTLNLGTATLDVADFTLNAVWLNVSGPATVVGSGGIVSHSLQVFGGTTFSIDAADNVTA
ncbi:MAG TPA: hypothetical protein PKC18_19500, partial [Lacipirellulaceae bacterium]|nr:hypothetical protein [Lacipirellulaceae bacterium]